MCQMPLIAHYDGSLIVQFFITDLADFIRSMPDPLGLCQEASAPFLNINRTTQT